MIRHDIPWLSAAETAVAITTKQVSPVEVVQAYLERIERLDGQHPSSMLTMCAHSSSSGVLILVVML
jgi:Asp-tRNA(Asn)/Glu-tRNA(Gln) amidotransferase A subunit family amidase